ncbi:MAG TPA: ABC transporter ATP-binding protein [Candidatus Desulfofervidus auxilii]|uniref:ABC transporter ATP-binding protein n=1 Tax=Desulfofervidus auxilii TaxID=1621989 RepID=A0A7C0Y801_DESA2|nr:ABC transporter ATP-binding protein [Candidatus Desulfofervidus auxilii]
MIEIINLHKKFGKLEVLKGVNLILKKGEITAIIGRSGCGKTVLVKHIVGLLKPDKGKIIVDGEDITAISEKKLKYIRRKFGMLFQEGALFDSMTVAENIAFPLKEHTNLSEKEIKKIVKEKLALVGLKDIEKKMPNELSGGMKKRVALARAIALEPEIVIYDEPTTGLDPMASVSIYELIQDMEKRLKITSIIITHDVPNVFAVANRIAVLHEGKIIACDTPENIVKLDKPEIQAFLKTQMKFKL